MVTHSVAQITGMHGFGRACLFCAVNMPSIISTYVRYNFHGFINSGDTYAFNTGSLVLVHGAKEVQSFMNQRAFRKETKIISFNHGLPKI